MRNKTMKVSQLDYHAIWQRANIMILDSAQLSSGQFSKYDQQIEREKKEESKRVPLS